MNVTILTCFWNCCVKPLKSFSHLLSKMTVESINHFNFISTFNFYFKYPLKTYVIRRLWLTIFGVSYNLGCSNLILILDRYTAHRANKHSDNLIMCTHTYNHKASALLVWSSFTTLCEDFVDFIIRMIQFSLSACFLWVAYIICTRCSSSHTVHLNFIWNDCFSNNIFLFIWQVSVFSNSIFFLMKRFLIFVHF